MSPRGSRRCGAEKNRQARASAREVRSHNAPSTMNEPVLVRPGNGEPSTSDEATLSETVIAWFGETSYDVSTVVAFGLTLVLRLDGDAVRMDELVSYWCFLFGELRVHVAPDSAEFEQFGELQCVATAGFVGEDSVEYGPGSLQLAGQPVLYPGALGRVGTSFPQ